MKKLILLPIAVILCFVACKPKHNFKTISVNGLDFNEQYTPLEVLSALGEPNTDTTIMMFDEFLSKDVQRYPRAYADIEFPDTTYSYTYETNDVVDYIDFDNNERLVYINIETTRFSINNFLKVGDNISKVEKMGGTLKRYDDDYIYWKPTTDNTIYSELGLDIFHNEDNIITKLHIFASPF